MPRDKTNPSKDFHKRIRRLLDDGKFDEIIQSIRTFAESDVTILADTIANVLANFHNIPIPSGKTQETVDYLLSHIKEKDYTELVYTSLIKIYAECEPMFLKYYEMMKKNGVPVKRRTLAPIFEFSPTLSFTFFNEAKVQGINLNVEDYCNILMNLTRECHNFHRSMVVEDMVKNTKGAISEEDVDHLQMCLTNIPGRIDPPPSFTLSKKEKDKMLEKMKIYVGHFYGKNPRVLGTITKAMGVFQKMKYNTVIDGANVGFFKRGVLSGKKICFNQLFNLGNQLITGGYNPLIILHQHHVDTATADEKEMIKINKVPMFIVPKGGDDDWFWLYAALSNTKSLLVTNDEMRNHFHYMNFDSEFIDWKTTHVVQYDMNESKKFTLNFPDSILQDMVINRTTRTIKVCDNLGKWSSFSF